MDKPVALSTGRIVAFFLTLGLIALIAALPACSDEPNQLETVVSEVNTLDRPEIVEVLFHPIRTGRVPAPEGAVDIDVTVAEGEPRLPAVRQQPGRAHPDLFPRQR